MQKKLGQAEHLEKIIQLEERLKESRTQKLDIKKKIKDMEHNFKDLGKALEKMSNEEDYQNRLRSLVEELRVQKDRVRKLHEQQEKE